MRPGALIGIRTWRGTDPAAFGAFLGIEDFASFQVPFESVFEGWSGGAANNGMTKHLTRAADGDYIWTAGWPSLTGVQVKPFLDQPATGKRVFMRVCDWWRREGRSAGRKLGVCRHPPMC